MLYDIAIVGGGPSGIMAALSAARFCKKIIIIEKNEKVGRKLLATGNGRCNLTNRFTSVQNYHGGNPRFVESILNKFGYENTVTFFESLGLILKEENNGRIFPRTDQASSVLNLLLQELNEKKVEISYSTRVENVNKDDFWEIKTSNKVILAQKLIVCTGGQAAFQLGSSGDGAYWAKKLGHKIVPLFPALVPLETKETWPQEIQGLKVEAKVQLLIENELVEQRKGELLFTHYGVSGPAILQLSHFVAPMLAQNKIIELKIDLFPEQREDELDKQLEKIFQLNGAKNIKNALSGVLPNHLIPIILNLAQIEPEDKAARLSKLNRQKIVSKLKNLSLHIINARPFKEAQVSSGGIDLDEVNPETLESLKFPGLYFAGEVLDVHGDSGGFNLQWAWSTGYVAGKSSAKALN